MNLVVQGAALAPDALGELAALVGANHVVTLGGDAYRLTGAQETPMAEPWCAQRQLDFAWVPDERRLADVRLVAMDMDSTLVTIESIDEMGDVLGIKRQIAALTAQAMRGEIDYPESLRRRVALLSGLEEVALERICEKRMHLSAGAEALISRCRQSGIRTLLVSGGSDMGATYISLVEAEDNRELIRLIGKQSNRFDSEYIDSRKWKDRKVFIRIVDQARGGWGHINFGGIYHATTD